MPKLPWWRPYVYLLVLTGPLAGYFSLTYTGIWPWLLPIYVFGLIPLIELFTARSTYNFSSEEEEHALDNHAFDYLLYLMIPVQYILLFYFLSSLNHEGLTYSDIAGRILTMGISCVVLGINVGHELGHRVKWYEQWMSKALLLSTLYMHFFIEHNRGHHKRVATPEDPASARYGESLYGFWFRSVFFSYISAWKIELVRLNKHGRKWWSPYNQMLHYLLISFGFCFAIYAFFDVYRLLGFIIAATIGFLFLETVNYLEHYGLQRAKLPGGKYEKVQAKHSWNSNHWIGRLFLFELTRHSDHHYKASRKYQVLRHFDDAPQLPFGYPVMIMMSMLPPLWFYVMHDHMRKYGFEASHLKQN